MAKKAATKAESDHMDAVCKIGCIACYNMNIESPAGIHHVRHVDGAGNAVRDHLKTIGLCSPHHQFHGQCVSIHDGLESWEERHGTEADLLDQVNQILGIDI
jgi:hypothetical protein